jgi:proline iminopeptidase
LPPPEAAGRRGEIEFLLRTEGVHGIDFGGAPGVVTLDLTKANKLAVPLILFLGRHDRNVNAEVAAVWFDAAPAKQLVWFEHSAHIPMTEDPGKFLLSLVRYARPIAEKAGAVAP